MKKIIEVANNRTATMQKGSIEMLRESGQSRDNLLLREKDIIEIPEDIDVWFDTFVPKGKTEAITYYLLTIEFNGKPWDATMKTFRRSRDVRDEDLSEILANDINRYLHSAGDDEQRAAYLKGKKLIVDKVLTLKSRFDDGKIIRVPLFSLAD